MKKVIILSAFAIGTTCSFAQTTTMSSKKTQEPIVENKVEGQIESDTVTTLHSTSKVILIEKIPLQKKEENKAPEPIINSTQKKPKQ